MSARAQRAGSAATNRESRGPYSRYAVLEQVGIPRHRSGGQTYFFVSRFASSVSSDPMVIVISLAHGL